MRTRMSTTTEHYVPLIAAVKNENIEAVKALLTDQSRVYKFIDHETSDGYTALIWASILNACEIMRVLLSAGADPNFETARGRTALIAAAQFGECDAVGLLLQAGAEVDHLTRTGLSALLVAARAGMLPAVKLLIKW